VAGIKLAVVSNFDTRLRPILEELHLVDLFDCVVISAEVGAEKPNPVIFEKACSMLGVTAAQALVLGDDRRQATATVACLFCCRNMAVHLVSYHSERAE